MMKKACRQIPLILKVVSPIQGETSLYDSHIELDPHLLHQTWVLRGQLGRLYVEQLYTAGLSHLVWNSESFQGYDC